MKVRRYIRKGKNRCMFCGHCIVNCSKGCFRFEKTKPNLTYDDKIVYDPSKCNGCGECVRGCPEGVIKLIKNKKK